MDKSKNPQQRNPFQTTANIQKNQEKLKQNPQSKNPSQKKPASNW